MLFSSSFSLKTLVAWCRTMRHGLQAGLDIPRVLEMQAKNGPMEMRKMVGELAVRLRAGDSFHDALTPYTERFPPLFVELLLVGEESGNLPEIFGEMEKYFTLRLTLQKQFISAITLPVIQFIAAIFVIAGLILILSLIGAPFKVFGLSGVSGAISWLVMVLGTLFLLWFGYKTIQNDYAIRGKIESILLRIPKLGACLRSFVMLRFCTAFHLTMGAGIAVKRAIDLSLRATGNAMFINGSKGIQHSIKVGHDLSESLAMSRLFEERFIHVLEVAETSGRVAESMEQQAKQYAEEGEHQLKALTSVASFAVWAIIAIIMIFFIFSIANIYLGTINSLTDG